MILGLSGGVDSSVAAALIHKAIGEQLTCVFVDHGLLRLNEAEQVMDTFAQAHARQGRSTSTRRTSSMARSKGVADPEEKRKIIGRAFRRGVPARGGEDPQREMARAGHDLSRRDRIGRRARPRRRTTIKSHHNVGGLPETLHLKLLEPLRELFKDEVRELGLALGLPREMVFRHPFPGPGPRRAHPRRGQDANTRICCGAPTRSSSTSCARAGWYDKTAQAFAVFLPVRSVGVMGDGRTYEYVVALRAVQTADFMTAHWAQLPHALLSRGLQPHHQRGARHQPRGLRHLEQAARDDRVGVGDCWGCPPAWHCSTTVEAQLPDRRHELERPVARK